MDICFKPIGVVHTYADRDKVKKTYFGVEGVIEVFSEYEDGLAGIEDFSHIIVVAYLHGVSEQQRRVLRVKPRRFKRFGIEIEDLPEVGVFCTDSPHRPNPIALSIVKLIERRGCFLRVSGLDLFDGTPVLDIKAYTPSRIVSPVRVPEWYVRLEERIRNVFGKIGYV